MCVCVCVRVCVNVSECVCPQRKGQEYYGRRMLNPMAVVCKLKLLLGIRYCNNWQLVHLPICSF